jgi:hypothetical protein
MFLYGVILPWVEEKKKYDLSWLKNKFLVIPPTFLIPGFLMATLLMLDFQTGYEEEIGEMFFSICFLLMMQWYHHLFSSQGSYSKREPTDIKELLLVDHKRSA